MDPHNTHTPTTPPAAILYQPHLAAACLDGLSRLVHIRQGDTKVTKALPNVVAVNTIVVGQLNCRTMT
jgi:hypothetical protein